MMALELLCRAPHPYPLGEGVHALPLGALAEAWGLAGPVGAGLE